MRGEVRRARRGVEGHELSVGQMKDGANSGTGEMNGMGRSQVVEQQSAAEGVPQWSGRATRRTSGIVICRANSRCMRRLNQKNAICPRLHCYLYLLVATPVSH